MFVCHNAQNVSERINNRGCNKPSSTLAMVRNGLIKGCSQGYEFIKSFLQMINMPVGNGSCRFFSGSGRSVFAVNDTQFVLVVSETKFCISGNIEIRFYS